MAERRLLWESVFYADDPRRESAEMTKEQFQTQLNEIEALGREDVVPCLVALVLKAGIENGASDIHLEPGPSRLGVRFRVDGVLQHMAEIGVQLSRNVIARVKVLANLLTYRTDLPQEGRIDGAEYGGQVDLRVSTFPTVHGEKAVIRIFDPSKRTFDIDALGMAPDVRGMIEQRLRRPQGVLLLTGPSGSGKTTTIYACLRFLVSQSGGTRNIVTVEDPVEYVIEGVTQTQANSAVGLTFARAMRSLLRQDPEVIMIGEIRDPETARIAIEAGLTGHLVISTIHSGDACGVFNRLLDMGVEGFLITSSVNLVLAQRLVRVLCKACKRPAAGVQGEPTVPGVLSDRVYGPIGCTECLHTGYRGRTLLAEVLTMSPSLKEAILKKADEKELFDAAVASGMKPFLEAAAEKINQGITTPAEVRRVMVV